MHGEQERRSRPRIDVDLEMRYEKDGREHTCRLTNISLDGVLLRTTELYDPGDTLSMTFRLPNEPGEIRIAGRVAWGGSLEGEKFGNFRIGVRFENLKASERDRVEAYIQSVLDRMQSGER